jgi:hypothetical protein
MKRIASTLALVLAAAGCHSGAPESATTKTTVATATAGALTVELLTDGELRTGLTPVYLRVRSASGDVTDAAVTFMPMMTMTGGMSHGAPMLSDPSLDAEGLYRCDVVFQMASGMMGSWSATAEVTRPGSGPVVASFPSLAVADSGRARTFTWFDPDLTVTTKYVSSLDLEAAPKVGLNPVVVTLHRMQDMMTFVSVDDAAITLDPQMPSMGHGSPGSVDPAFASSGLYRGQLSFSMAGDWETTVTFKRSGVTIGAPKFTTTF